MVGEMQGGERSLRQGGTGGGSMWNWPCRGLPSHWAIWKTRAASRVTGPLLKFLQTKIAPMSGYDLPVLWPSSLSARLSHSNSHTKTKLMLKPEEQLCLLRTRRKKKKNIMRKFNNCVESSVFIIPSLLSDRDDLLVTNCVDLNRGPFGEPFHHFNSTGSNSHDLMRCRMPEICCLCFLFSPSTLSHQQQPRSITGRSGWQFWAVGKRWWACRSDRTEICVLRNTSVDLKKKKNHYFGISFFFLIVDRMHADMKQREVDDL